IHGHSGASLARDRASGIHPFATRILDCLNAKKGRTHHELAKSSGLSEAETLAVLGLLELSGAARETPTGWKAQSA
ncbi:MAG: hypothetical protein RLZZ600_572, partial [Actinomycetota bacterium]